MRTLQSGVVLAAVLIAIIAIGAYRYDRYVLHQDYIIDAAAPCDPATGTCFATDCSSDEDASCDVTPYEKVELPASEAPGCLIENSCDTFSCTEANDCVVTACSPDTTEDGETCAAAPASPPVDPADASTTAP